MTAISRPSSSGRAFDVERIRADFPILKLEVNGKPLVFLDNAASQPDAAAGDRPPGALPDDASTPTSTAACTTCRRTRPPSTRRRARKVQHFINAREEREVIFTSGTTDAINLVTHGYGRKFIGAGDEIILTTLEHHSNIVPWQMLAEEKGAKIRVVPINDAGELLIDEYEKLFNAAHQARRRDARLECARHDQSGQAR